MQVKVKVQVKVLYGSERCALCAVDGRVWAAAVKTVLAVRGDPDTAA